VRNERRWIHRYHSGCSDSVDYELSPLYCLVRGNGNIQARLVDAVTSALKTAQNWGVVRPQFGRLVAISGDLTKDTLVGSVAGRRNLVAANIREIWHCAAALCFENHRRKEIFGHTVTGTERVLALAMELGAKSFRHLSTEYVAGKRRGKIPEGPYDPAAPCNNLYEESKRMAEDRVLAAGGGRLSVKLFRPSIVIGNSRTLQTSADTGLYGFLQGVATFADEVEDKVPGYLARYPQRIMSEPGDNIGFDSCRPAGQRGVSHRTKSGCCRHDISPNKPIRHRDRGSSACRAGAIRPRLWAALRLRKGRK
jgi:thioester reductase-like protein